MSNRDRIGRYLLVDEIGIGGMGAVYLAYDTILKREVALKTMMASLIRDERLRRRFFIEAQSAGILHHPNVVTIYDLGHDDHGCPYIAMEFLTGLDLDQVISEKRRLPLSKKLDIILQVCRGLAYAHANGIIHRDIKPSNVRILDEGLVKIMDFGIAKLDSTEVTNTGYVVGTPHYLAPEIIRGQKADARSDVFSVGVLLYELVSFKKPFDADNPHAILYQITNVDPQPLIELDSSIPKALSDLAARVLAKDAAERYQTCDHLADQLQRVYAAAYARESRILASLHASETDMSGTGQAFELSTSLREALRDTPAEPDLADSPAGRRRGLVDVSATPSGSGVSQLVEMLLDNLQLSIPDTSSTRNPGPPVPFLALDVLEEMCRTHYSGVVTVSLGSKKKSFVVRQGSLILCQSTEPDDDVWASLLRRNVISATPPEQASFRKALSISLLQGELSLEAFKSAYRETLESAFLGLWDWPGALLETHHREIGKTPLVVVPAASLIVRLSIDRVDYATVRSPDNSGFLVTPLEPFKQVISTLSLKPEEGYLVAIIQSESVSLHILRVLTGLSEETICRFVFGLSRAGAVKLQPEESPAARIRRATPIHVPLPADLPVDLPEELPAEPSRARAAGNNRGSDPPQSMGGPAAGGGLVIVDIEKQDRKALIQSQLEEAAALRKRAEASLAAGDYQSAIDFCKRATRLVPDDAAFYALLARAYAAHPKSKRHAERYFHEAIGLDPSNVTYHLELIRLYLQSSLQVNARTHCLRILQIEPGNRVAQALLRKLDAPEVGPGDCWCTGANRSAIG
ncbi:MAG: protein kinase [Candidatus Schekmanbacteria bacterium]|nr:protein kinase [Candidatus Schekmanbacteria bacterium]